ncbi:hypothetical protein RCO28_26580 [Streptomyces sp. LHD-70]|uniref:hypothetical protein n=1 Tax=Streptomyces sp. LHD-70 TaxID=3072140 RepID=UPI0028100E5D|nr:hypothetical protein [Streptomyces sp. LHD-70]MDQ8706017.1 hypothetical protein [Streptomyces sp. LHD-70]
MTTPEPQPAPITAPALTEAAVLVDPFAPSTKAVRVFAGIGLLLLPVVVVVFVIIVLNQSYSGDGVAGPLVGMAPWAMGVSGVLGLLALILPSDMLTHPARSATVKVQYALAVAAPILAAVDFG